MGNRGRKSDEGAREMWGGATYDAIPKSVFALAAWHMASCLAGDGTEGEAEARFAHEVDVLMRGDHLPATQGRAALRKLPAPKAPE
jgi:hypothetical protein